MSENPDRRAALLAVQDDMNRPLITFRIVDGILTAEYDPADLDEAARVFLVYLMASEMDRLVEAQRATVDMLIEGTTLILECQEENSRLREALSHALDCMKDFQRTPVAARATLKDDIAYVESALSKDDVQ